MLAADWRKGFGSGGTFSDDRLITGGRTFCMGGVEDRSVKRREPFGLEADDNGRFKIDAVGSSRPEAWPPPPPPPMAA